jgi:uncharacterized membrane protein YqjE
MTTTPERIETKTLDSPTSPVREDGTAELLKRLIHDLRVLVSTELRLARRELTDQAKGSVLGLVILGSGAIFSVAALAMVLVAIFVGLGGTALAAIGMACVLFAIAAVLGVAGWLKLPREPLPRTEERVTGEARDLREAVAS